MKRLPMIVDKTPEGKMGPAMRALPTDKQRAFVMAICETGGKNFTTAARMAGYGGESEEGLRVIAHRLAHDEDILRAIKEEADRRLRAGALLGASVMVEIARDEMHKDRFKAASELIKSAGLNLPTSKVEHVHSTKSNEEAIAAIVGLAKAMGVDPKVLLGNVGYEVPAPKEAAVEGEFTDVTPSMDGLEDLL